MIRTTVRKARRTHRCTCGHIIRPREVYLEHVASPRHDCISSDKWERLAECEDCAYRYGRGVLLVEAAS